MKRETPGESTGLARALSKLGFCSRSNAFEIIKAGRVRVNGVVQRDSEKRVSLGDKFTVDGESIRAERKVYLMLNKPRGLVTSAADEQGRDTVFSCFVGAGLPRIFPVGRLDKASEGLLLFTNDSAWANAITDPASHLDKIYHVQIDRVADGVFLQELKRGVKDGDELLRAKRVSLLRAGEKNSWLEIVLDEGKNRHVRRMLAAQGVEVLRLVRVAIGDLQLGDLAKGNFRELRPEETLVLTARVKHASGLLPGSSANPGRMPGAR